MTKQDALTRTVAGARTDRGTLRMAIVGFALLVTAAFWVAAILLGRYDLDRTLLNVDAENRGLVRTLSEHAARTIDYADRIALEVKARHEEQARGFDLERYGRDGRINRKIVPGIMIADARGEVRQMDVPSARPANISDVEYFRIHAGADNGQPFISRPLLAAGQNRYNLFVSRRLNRRDGAFDGIVSVAIDPDVFAGFYRDVGLGNNGLIVLTGVDGYVRAQNAGAVDAAGQDVGNSPLFKAYGSRDSGDVRFQSPTDGVTRRAAFRRVTGYPLVLAVGIAEETMLAEVNGRMHAYYAGAAAASVLCLLAAVALLAMLRRRNAAARALQESDEGFRRVTENFGDVFWLTDPVKQQLLYTSPACARVWGRNLERIYATGLDWVESLHAEDRERALNGARARRASGDYDEQYRLVWPDGTIRWVRDRAFPVRNGAGEVVRILGVVEDVTHMRELELSFLSMVDSLPDATFINQEDRIVHANPAALRMLRATAAAQVTGKSPLEFVHPDDRAGVRERVARYLTGEEVAGLHQQRFVALDGTVIEAETSVSLTRANGKLSRLVVARDITQRKNFESALRESEARYRRLVEESPDATFINRGETVLYANPAALRLLGADTADQVVGKSIFRYVHPDQVEEVRRLVHLMDSDASYDARLLRERLYMRFDGSTVDVETSTARIKLADGVARQVVVRDISARKRAEAALRESEARYRMLVENCPDGILIYDDHVVDYVNKAGIELLGAASAADIIGRPMIEFIDPADRGAALARRAYVKQTGKPTGLQAQTYVRFDGTKVEGESSVMPIGGAHGDKRMVVIRDISMRKRAEAARDESEARQRLAFKAAGITNWEWDIASDTTHWGPHHEQLLGPLPAGADRYPGFPEMVHAEDRERFLAAVRAARDHGEPYDVEFRLVRTDGRICWLRGIGRAVRNAEGKIDRMVGIVQDITRRRDIERELVESHRRRDALLEGIPAPAWLKDRNGRFVAANGAWAARHNIARHEIAGKTDAEIFSAEQVALIRDEDRRVIETGASLTIERRRYAEDDAWSEVVKAPVLDDDGKVVAVVGISHDITERKRNERAIKTMNEALAQKTAQLTALNRELEAFSYSVSHDLRAPLRSILGFGGFLLKDSFDRLDAEGQERLQRILAASERMGQLIDDLLRLARISRQAMTLGKVQLDTLAAEAVAELRAASPQRQVEVVIAPGLTEDADRGLMRIVLDNLLGNAWKFTAKRADARIEFGVTDIGARRTYFVRDNGAGFDMSYAGKLFAPFQRMHSHQQFEGTGIGLATVKRIVERHQGRVWVDSVVDQGTTVYFTVGERELPAAQVPAETAVI